MTTPKKQQALGVSKSKNVSLSKKNAVSRSAKPVKSRAQKQKAALASRAATRAYLANRRSAILVLPKPEFDTLNAEGLVSRADSKKPLPITVDVSSLGLDPAAGDVVDIHMRGRGVSGWGTRLYRINSGFDDPIVRDLPVSRLTPGEHEVGYIVLEGMTTPTESFPAPLKIDHTKPFDEAHPPAPNLPGFVVAAGEINKKVIDDNPDGMVCTYSYSAADGRETTDRVLVYFSTYTSSHLSDPIDSFPVNAASDFTLEWDDLNLTEGGKYYLVLVFVDLAGNISKDSKPAEVIVRVVGDPVPLAAEVDLAPLPADGLIDLADAQNPDGVHVIIRSYTNNLSTDVIELSWGDEDPLRYLVAMYLPFPLYLPIPPDVIFDDYGSSTGEQNTAINYVVDRGGVTTDAPETVIAVDLSAPGPAPGEDEENDLLALVTVIGGDPSQPNVLLPSDFGNNATVTLDLWSVPLPAPGITVTVYWGDLAHPLIPQTLSTEGPGATLTYTVPWSHIREVGNGPAIPVFYTLSWPTNNNIQRSPPRPVDVRANQIKLEQPTFRKASTPMACPDLELVTREAVIRIPGNTVYFKEHDVIKVQWQIFSNAAGTTPLGAPFLFYSPPLTPDMVSNGFNLKIGPYTTVVRPCARNSVDIHYFVNVPGEGEVPSDRGFTTTRFANIGNQFCEDLPVLKDPSK